MASNVTYYDVAMDTLSNTSLADDDDMATLNVTDDDDVRVPSIFDSHSFVSFLQTFCPLASRVDRVVTIIWYIIGVTGNILSAKIWLEKRMRKNNSSAIYLATLSISDLIFLLLHTLQEMEYAWGLRTLDAPVLCEAYFMFIFVVQYLSPILVLAFTCERYIAVCHVMKWTSSISVKRTKLIIAATFLASAIFNTPVLWRYRVQSLTSCSDDVTTFSLEQQVFVSSVWDHAYRAAWAVCGNIVPVILLTLLHFRLSRAIHQASRASALLKHQSTARRRDGSGRSARSSDERNSRRITRTLLAIVVMFLVLVAPSEIVKQLAVFAAGEQMQSNYVYLTLEVVTNVTQSVNFCANFILYCCVNPSFRQQVRAMFCRRNRRRRNVDDTTRARGTEMVEEDDVDECCDMTSRRAWRSRSSERHGLNGSAV